MMYLSLGFRSSYTIIIKWHESEWWNEPKTYSISINVTRFSWLLHNFMEQTTECDRILAQKLPAWYSNDKLCKRVHYMLTVTPNCNENTVFRKQHVWFWIAKSVTQGHNQQFHL